MNDNLLLAYLSELGQGKWPQFRQALDYLAEENDELYRSVKARQLSALGHVEFAFEGDLHWAVCEPTIAWLSRDDQLKGVLCGQRSQRLLDDLADWCERFDCELACVSQKEGPDVISILSPTNDVGEQLAQKVSLRSQLDAAERLAEILPDITSHLSLCSNEPAPRGYKTERYETDQGRWLEVDSDIGPGFYRYIHYQREYRLKINGTTWKTPPYIGIFPWLQHEKRIVFTYDPKERTLRGPANVILPPLFARAVTLCSGLLPRFERNHHIYVEVPGGVAYHLLHKLHQEQER